MQSAGNRALSNLQFDLVTILHSKGEGIEAYDKYIRDAQAENSQECVELLQRLKQQDEQAVMEIKQHVIQVLQHGSMSGQSMQGGSSSQGFQSQSGMNQGQSQSQGRPIQ